MKKLLYIFALLFLGCSSSKAIPLLTTTKKSLHHPHNKPFPIPVCSYINEWDVQLLLPNADKVGCWCMVGPLVSMDRGERKTFIMFLHSDNVWCEKVQKIGIISREEKM